MINDKKILYKLLALLTIVIWVSAYIFTKLGLKYFSALSLSVFRYLAASIALIVVLVIKKIPFPQVRDMPFFFVTGLFGFTIYVITFNIGAQSVSVATSSIIISTTPIITVLIASFLYRERLSIYQWIAVLLEFTGVIIICLWDNMFSFNGGMLWIIAAAFSFSIYNILQRKLTTKYSPLQSTSYSMLTASVLLMFFLPQSVPELEYSTIEAVISVLVMGILCSVLAYILWSKALSLAPKTSDVTNYLFLSPFLSAILGFVFLKEIPNLGTWIGGSIVLFGMLLFERKQN